MTTPKKVMEYTLKNVNHSLLSKLLTGFQSNEEPDLDFLIEDFEAISLPFLAEKIVLFSGLLIQAFWFREKSEGRVFPHELEEPLRQIWVGHHNYTLGFASDILKGAGIFVEGEYADEFVKESIFSIIEEWLGLFETRRQHYKDFDDSITGEIYDSFIELIDALPVLRNAKMFDGKIIFTNLGGGDNNSFTAFPLFYETDEYYLPLYLYSMPSSEQPLPKIEFRDLEGNDIEIIDLSKHKELRENVRQKNACIGLESKVIKERIIYLFSDDYKYIKLLAQAIEASLCEGDFTKLKKYCKRHGGDAVNKEFNEVKNGDFSKKDYLTLMLVSLGPHEIVSYLLKESIKIYEDIMSFFEEQLIGPHRFKEIIEEQQKLFTFRENQIKEIFPQDVEKRANLVERMETLELQAEVETKEWAILQLAGLAGNKPVYSESIDEKIELAKDLQEEMKHGEATLTETNTEIGKLLGRTFRFLISFYAGLEAYADVMLNSDSSKIESVIEQAEEAMIEKGKDRLNNFSGFTLGKYFGAFRNLVNKANGPDFSDKLEAVIGRPFILDKKEYISLVEEELPPKKEREYPIEDKRNLCAIRNFIEHPEDHPPDKFSEITLKALPKYVIDFFVFLKNGQSSELKFLPLKPIYPMAIELEEISRRQGDMIIYNYGIRRQGKVNIISPRQFFTGQRYYCIPNYNRSTKNWWLDPFLIRSDKFDSIFART